MKYIRAKHPAICWPLLPWFIEGNQTREEIFLELYARLEQESEDTFVEVALEGDFCKGMLVAYILDEHLWIWQARASQGFKHSRDVFDHAVQWAKERGIKAVRMETYDKRFEKLYKRRYGFHKVGKVMERAI